MDAERTSGRPGHWRFVLYLAVAAIVIAAVAHGTASGEFQRAWAQIAARPSGVLRFRFLVQPLMAVIIACRDGIADARADRAPYFWTVLTGPGERVQRLREGFAAIAKIFVLAVVLDGIYQVITLKAFHPGQTLVIAVFLAFVPYLLARGPAARIARWRPHRRAD